MLTDLIDDFISRARSHVDAHPVRYAFADAEIERTIRVMERLRELLDLGERPATQRDIVKACALRREIEVSTVLMMRGR
jgi:hypothetical protein